MDELGQLWSRTPGSSGLTGCLNDQNSRCSGRIAYSFLGGGAGAGSPHTAPDFTHAARSVISASLSLPCGGIFSFG